MLRLIGVEAVEVRLPAHLEGLDGLILPGGESTTIGKLAVAYQLMKPLADFARRKAVWGTCAGAIFLSKDVHLQQHLLQVMDIIVERNAFGRQVDSFEVDLDVPALAELDGKAARGGKAAPYHAVFIRAPLIESVSGSARVLAKLDDGRIVAVQQGRLLATSFHPELTRDDRFHRYFARLAGGQALQPDPGR